MGEGRANMDARTNLDRHLRGSRRLDLTGVAWERISDYPLSAAETRCLAYMMDIESHTMVFLRDLLCTRAAEDARLSAFLACWVYEELWHGEALSRFLGQAGVRWEPDADMPGWDASYPSRIARIGRIRADAGGGKSRLTRFGIALASRLLGGLPAAHMAWGAINELSTLTAYERLVARTANPVLADLLSRIVRDEKRHYSFYRVEADRRLSDDARARRLTRVALDRCWAIVGTGVRPLAETDFMVLHLFGDDDGLSAAIGMDRSVDSLPGLFGLRLFERARAAAISRAGGRAHGGHREVPAGSCSTGS
jgi:rubrerythrin